jgi:hypothetical protein
MFKNFFLEKFELKNSTIIQKTAALLIYYTFNAINRRDSCSTIFSFFITMIVSAFE